MANVTKKYALSAKGIFVVEDDIVGIENTDTGEFLNFKDLLVDFKDKFVKFSINYDEDCD